MRIIVSYDLLNSIRNIKNPMGPLKVIRNNKKKWAKLNLPIYTSLDLIVTRDLKKTGEILLMQFGFLTVVETIFDTVQDKDKYKKQSTDDLNVLVETLNDNNIKTDLNLLLDTKLYDRNYRIRLNENKLPELAESKYLLVPTYTATSSMKDTKVLQEHVVGSDKYVLSFGTPKKEKKLVPVYNFKE